jgi:hypothetical protein
MLFILFVNTQRGAHNSRHAWLKIAVENPPLSGGLQGETRKP